MKRLLIVMMVLCFIVFSAGLSFAATGAALADEGADLILSTFFSDTAKDSAIKISLYCTDISPADTDTYSTYTWCTGTVGEQPKSLTVGSGWAVTGTAPTQAEYAQQDFSFTGDLTTNTTIYGYCLHDSGSTTLIGCQALTSAFTPHSGYHLYVTPIMKLSKGTPN
jgi:hypothetical protein